MNLQLEHLQSYDLHKLEFMIIGIDKIKYKVDALFFDDSKRRKNAINMFDIEKEETFITKIEKIKPILKSISDISQSEINELFEMFGDLCRIGNQLHFEEFLREHFENLDTLPLRVCQELAKRGYDIFNLLENNLAINFYSC